jgi:LytS/YehU family sensor histidine kinase
MLRYVFEECSQDRVILKSEIEYIENFISFQRMKSPNEQNIVFENETTETNKMIAPMLFIPFIENSFKYSRIEEEQNAYVNIDMTSNHEKIRFEIRNSIADSGRIKPGTGMGIENVKQRLEIIYPDNYSLDIRQENQEYCVTLEITLA